LGYPASQEIAMFRVTGLMLLTVSVSTLTPALAQGPGTKFGAIIGGATLSDMDNFPAVGDSRWGGTAGFLVGVNAGRTALTLEGTWVQKGGVTPGWTTSSFP
jgi:hypothetical protein